MKMSLLTRKEQKVINKIIEISEEDQFSCPPFDLINALEKEKDLIRKDYLKRSKWRTQTGSYHASFNRKKDSGDSQNTDIVKGKAYKQYALTESRIEYIIGLANISGYNTTRFIYQYNRILDKFPNAMFALINLSDKLIKVNKFREAEKYARKAYLLYHDINDMTVVNYSVILFHKKLPNEAIAICEAAMSESINDMLFNNLGFFFMRKGEYNKALLFYNKSISLNKRNGSAFCNRGILRYFVLNDDEGINDIIHAIDLGEDEAEDIIKVIRWGETKDYT